MADEQGVQLDDVDTSDVVDGSPPPPVRAGGPAEDWEHRTLYDSVLRVLYALPARFRTKLTIAGVSATDLFTLNTPLGAAIEVNVVEALNDLRPLWDPTNRYSEYSFVRHAQAFPDVRFQRLGPGPEPILFGIELKGWFVLGKEGEPSFRYKISPAACASADILAVFPWVLDEVTSGSPKLLKPFVTEAKHAAEYRNYYWQYGRQTDNETTTRDIELAREARPYPSKADKANDKPAKDSGNFGRVARGGFMTSFVEEVLEDPIGGIPARYWQRFLKIFAEGASAKSIETKLKNIRREIERSDRILGEPDVVNDFLLALERLVTER